MGKQTIALILWCAAGYIIKVFICSRFKKRIRKIANLCLWYVVSLGAFGQLYSILYTSDPANFIFSAEILSRKRLESTLSLARDVDNVEKLMSAVNLLLEELSSGHVSIVVSPVDNSLINISTEEYIFEFMFDPSWSGIKEGRRFRAARFLVKDNAGEKIGSERVDLSGPDLAMQRLLEQRAWDSLINSYFPPRTSIKYSEMLLPLRDRLEHTLNELKKDSDQTTNKNINDNWNFLDFFYFSTITQTTVGYGDILPNSSIVRCVVVAQVLAGLLLLGVAINFVAFDGESYKEIPKAIH